MSLGGISFLSTPCLCEEASAVRASHYCHLFSLFRFLFFQRCSVDTVSISKRLMCCVTITFASEASEVLGLTSFPLIYVVFLSLPSIFTVALEPFPLFVKLI